MLAGQRYVGEVQWRFAGDRDTAQQYIPQARLLMGAVLADAEVNRLGVHQGRKVLSDGTVLVADKIGDIKRITIVPTGGTPPPVPVRPLDDIVVWARDETRQAGIDAEHPQQILRVDTSGQGQGWTTFFFNSEIPGFDGFPGNKGTYGGQFDDGVRHAGNVDWVSPDDERISWYGPQCRYFFDGYVQPRSQYGKFVFMLGQALLDTDQYAADSIEQTHGPDRWVLGAALKRIDGVVWLYVFQSVASNLPLPSGTVEAGWAEYSAPFSGANQDVILYRYRLLLEVDALGVPRYRVSPNSREGLLAVTNMGAEPWIFNTSCTEARCIESASNQWFALIADHENVQPGDVVEQYPDTSQTLHRVTIGDDTVSHAAEALSVRDNGQAVAIASDWVEDERRDLLLVVLPGVVPCLRMGDLQVVLNNCEVGLDAVNRLERRYLLFADLRTQTMVFFRSHIAYPNGDTTLPDQGEGASVEIYHAGRKVFDTIPDRTVSGVPLVRSTIESSRKYASLSGRSMFPLFWLFGLCLLKTKPEDENPGTQGTNPDFAGACNSFGCLPLPAASYFGAYHLRQVSDMPIQTVGMRARPGFSADRADFDAHYSMLGCAGSEEVIALSMHNPLWHHLADPQFADRSIAYVTGSNLRNLTGVAGTFARFHPIWQIGKTPKIAAI